jgi:hypothetical protein
VDTRASFPWAEWPGHEADHVMHRLRMWGALSPLHHVFMCREQWCKLQASVCWLIWRDIGKEIVVQGLSLDLNSMRNIWEVDTMHSCVLRESGVHRRPSSSQLHRSSCAGIHLVTFLLLLTRISHLLITLTLCLS